MGARVAEIIGPAGVMLDGFECAGALIWHDGDLWVALHAYAEEVTAARGQEVRGLPRTECSLWLGGHLEMPARALLALVAPDIPQPDCAPGWMRFRAEDGTAGWVLTQSPQPNAWRDWCFRTPAYGSADFIPGADVHVVGASEESNPRRALALALTAAAEAKS